MKTEERFLQTLSVLAKTTNYPLDEFMLDMYTRELEPYGLEKVCLVLQEFLKESRRMPLINEIKAKLEPEKEISVDANANVAAASIIGCVRKWGYMAAKQAQEELGEVAWEIIRMAGGWTHVCEILTDKNQSIYIAQWRDLAKGIIQRRGAGLNLNPALPESSVKTAIKMIGTLDEKMK